MKAVSRYTFLAAIAVSAACTVHGVDVPPGSGPSELALSVTITATPDHVPQDGGSQSSIAVIAKGPDGKAVSGQAFLMETAVNGVRQDYGLLSARNVVTNADGRASLIYTAPPPPPVQGNGNLLTIYATPIGSNYWTANNYTAELRLTPVGVYQPPASAPRAQFTVSPTPVNAGVSAIFDASSSCATQSTCSNTAGITSFAWNFGDGTTGIGQTSSHVFSTAGTYTVVLTVTNDRGLSSSTIQAVTVSPTAGPTAAFVVSPTPPRVGLTLNFNADISTAGPGRRITQYSWNFGDGTPGTTTGFLTQHTYTATGTYTVVLSVMDDLGQKATTTQTLTVAP